MDESAHNRLAAINLEVLAAYEVAGRYWTAKEAENALPETKSFHEAENEVPLGVYRNREKIAQAVAG